MDRTLVWGHGLLSSVEAEDELGLFVWPDLEGVRVVRYDAPGHGRAPAASDPSQVEWPALGREMLRVADRVGADRFVAGGASMGCATALYAALAAPERVEALVLAIPPTAWETRAAQASVYAAGVALFRQDPQGAVDMMVAGLDAVAPLGETISAGYPESREIMKRHMSRLDPVRAAVVLEGASRSDLPAPDELAVIAPPALILAWTGDAGHPVSTAERLHELLANSELHVATSIDDVRRWPELVSRFL